MQLIDLPPMWLRDRAEDLRVSAKRTLHAYPKASRGLRSRLDATSAAYSRAAQLLADAADWVEQITPMEPPMHGGKTDEDHDDPRCSRRD